MKQKIIALCALIPLVCLITFAPASHAGPVTVNEFNSDSYQAILQQQAGHPFILLIWSLDCDFCQASLDLLAREQRAHPQLRVVTLATDFLSDPAAGGMLKNRLASSGLTAHAWAFGDAPPEQLRYTIDPTWHGEMPRSYWFNAQGVGTAVSGMIQPQAVDEFIRTKN